MFPQHFFLVFVVHEIRHIEVLDDIWQRWWRRMSSKQKKEQKITDVNYPYSQVEKLKLPEVNLYSWQQLTTTVKVTRPSFFLGGTILL